MKVSCSFASQLDTPENIKFAEYLGYSRAWCYDCPARFADIWMTLARAAERTDRIGLGTAVITAGYREVMTTAASIATLEALAPNRVAVGIGTGLGQASQGRNRTLLKDLRTYIIALRALLRGEEVESNGVLLKMMHDEIDLVPSVRNIPFLLASEGPKTLEMAEELCEGILSLSSPRAGQDWSAVIINGTVVEDDDPNADQQIMDYAGPGAAISYHALLHMGGANALDALPHGQEFRQLIERHPPGRRHLNTWSKHVTGMTAEEESVLTPQIVRQLGFTGSTRELRARLENLQQNGATEVIYQVAGPDKKRELSRFWAMAEPLASI